MEVSEELSDSGSSRFVAAVQDLLREAVARSHQAPALAGLDTTALRALDALAGGTMTVSEIRAVLGLSAAATTQVVDRLEEAGFAERSHDRVDRRRVLVSLTDEARDYGRRQKQPMLARIEAVCRRYSEAELLRAAEMIGALLPSEEEA
ncbi:MAG: MarR family transcriptional regulator [Actinomycetota bacterium]